jgi:hypothetical protein
MFAAFRGERVEDHHSRRILLEVSVEPLGVTGKAEPVSFDWELDAVEICAGGFESGADEAGDVVL